MKSKRPLSHKIQLARDFIAKFPGRSQRSIAASLMALRPEVWSSWDDCYATTRRAFGSMAINSRKGVKLSRPAGNPTHKSGKLFAPPAVPESKAKPWSQFDLNQKRILVLSDVHVPYHDARAVTLAVDWAGERKPDALLLNGDIADFYSISRYESDPGQRDFAGEIKSVREVLAFLRASFPEARMVYKLGNHEERWWHWIWRKAPELLGCEFTDFAALTHCDQHGIEVVANQRIISVGKLSVLHGHEWRAGISTPVNPARGAFLKANECAMQGHLHRTSEHTETSISGRVITCWSTGCLCDLHPEYARVNRWNHGFAEIEMHAGDFQVHNKRILNGKVF